ncbi:HAMP domain-containing protein [Clostridiaceae bacterium]|nr:HAMP domain-containing protein [Clostridiaceae bacterium]RKI15015.1 HAMP domain-containing protein [bacterium 1XD21-70]
MGKLPKTIRSKILLSTAAVTAIITTITVSVCFSLFQSFLRRNQLQSAEYSLQIFSENVSSAMENILNFNQWCCSNMDIGRYLEAFRSLEQMPSISSSNSGLRITALNAYDRLREEYRNTYSHEYLTRVIIIPANQHNYLQISDTSSAATSRSIEKLCEENFFQALLASSSGMETCLMEDPLTLGSGQILPVVRPIRSPYRSQVVGWSYLSISERIFLDFLEAFPLESDSQFYIHIGNHTYHQQGNRLKETAFSFQILSDLSRQAVSRDSLVRRIKTENGNRRIMVTCPLGPDGWSVSLILSEKAYQAQSQAYFALIAGIAFTVCLMGLILYILLNRIINRPVQKILEKITAISLGDFTREPSIEWQDELGLIGRGINQMSENVVMLMNKKVEDEKQKKDLEYQILQSQINPHFLYNTLNSIKWMATIQNATGIAEMTTSLARLMKNVSKGTTAQITLEEELALVKDYFLIQKYRYGGNISIEYLIGDPGLYQCLIHRFTLQPIIENALFHGIEPKGCAGKVTIQAEAVNLDGSLQVLRICVTDNGIGMSQETIDKVLNGNTQTSADFFRHVGISNVNQRIKYDFGEEYGIAIQSRPGEYTTMAITLPLQKPLPPKTCTSS